MYVIFRYDRINANDAQMAAAWGDQIRLNIAN